MFPARISQRSHFFSRADSACQATEKTFSLGVLEKMPEIYLDVVIKLTAIQGAPNVMGLYSVTRMCP